MAVSLYPLVVDAHDLPAQARFWCQVLDWRVLFEAEDEIVIGSDEYALLRALLRPGPRAQDRQEPPSHRPHAGRPGRRGERSETGVPPAEGWGSILALGARRADVGQGEDVSWVLLADPEGKELCVLRPKKSLVD
jgi:hypothetical protein